MSREINEPHGGLRRAAIRRRLCGLLAVALTRRNDRTVNYEMSIIEGGGEGWGERVR